LIEAVPDFTFQTEPVLERVAEAQMLGPIVLKRR
jgi:hypothetical protein